MAAIAGLTLSMGATAACSHRAGRQGMPPSTGSGPRAGAPAWSPTDPSAARVQLESCLNDVRQGEASAGDGAGPDVGDDWVVTAAVGLPPTSYRAAAVRGADGKVQPLASPSAVPASPMWFVAGRQNVSQNLAECIVKALPGGGFGMQSATVGPSALEDNYLPAPAVLKGVLEYGDLAGLAYGYYSAAAGHPHVEADGVRYPTYARAGVFAAVFPARSSTPRPPWLSPLVSSRSCWIRPDGTRLKQQVRAQAARGPCGTAFPPASR
jgi:hypothetical protein